jgi:hypothetical protein
LAGSPNAKIILILIANATTGVTVMNVATKCVAEDDETVDVTLTDDSQTEVTMPGTAYKTKKVTFTGGDLGNIAANDQVIVRIAHLGTDPSDTLAVNTILWDAYLEVDVP